MTDSMPNDRLVAAAAAGDRRALARLLTVIENGRDDAVDVVGALFRVATPSYRVGITGAPGAGKSTLTDSIVAVLRERGERVGVIAVDPTSPFSGGAILGDRVRMQRHALDEGVFIRSMASRGHLGGLSLAAPKALLALEAAGFDTVLVETVGVGQDEVEIASQADTVIVVVTPGWGDGVQAAKAGILEIADVFVVNKADRSGADDTVTDLRAMLALATDSEWEPPIVRTVATDGTGIDDLLDAVEAHAEHLGEAGMEGRRRRRRVAELTVAVAETFRTRAKDAVEAGGPVVEAVAAGEVDPWTGARSIVSATDERAHQ